jgi:Predicted glycosyltransferase
MADDKDIFTRVRAEDTAALFMELAKNKILILCKGSADNIIPLKALTYETGKQVLECRTDNGKDLGLEEDILGNFQILTEKYYFTGRMVSRGGNTFIYVTGDVFHLQRRQTYRVHIPESYKYFFNILKVSGRPDNIPGHLVDLSGGGCRVIYHMTTPLMKVGDIVTGQLRIGNRPALEVDGEVRHIKVDAVQKNTQIFGIEFKGMNSVVENKIFAITMELYKEIFKGI